MILLKELPNPEQELISNGNRTEWSPIRSVIIRVITLGAGGFSCAVSGVGHVFIDPRERPLEHPARPRLQSAISP